MNRHLKGQRIIAEPLTSSDLTSVIQIRCRHQHPVKWSEKRKLYEPVGEHSCDGRPHEALIKATGEIRKFGR